MQRLLIIFSYAFIMMACEQGPNADINTSDIFGSWILFERGYSPGAGYITEDVPLTPAQVLSLNQNGTMQATVKGLEKYNYYLILDDKDENKILAVFEDRPLTPPLDINRLEHSYLIRADQEGNIKLEFRWCMEGCHLRLRPRVTNDI